MDFVTVLTIILAVAIAVERVIEVIKPLYLQIKNKLLGKEYQECSKTEKIVMTILLGPVMCIIAQIGIDIPKVNEAAVIQYILAGLVSSMGSNVIHALLNIVVALKDAAEGIKPKAKGILATGEPVEMKDSVTISWDGMKTLMSALDNANVEMAKKKVAEMNPGQRVKLSGGKEDEC